MTLLNAALVAKCQCRHVAIVNLDSATLLSNFDVVVIQSPKTRVITRTTLVAFATGDGDIGYGRVDRGREKDMEFEGRERE